MMGLPGSFAVFAAAALVALALPRASRADDLLAAEPPPGAAGAVGSLDGSREFSYTADTTDRAVADRIVQALAHEPALEGSAITVLVTQGAARLSGSTRDEDQAAHALEVAREAAGPNVAVSGEALVPHPSMGRSAG